VAFRGVSSGVSWCFMPRSLRKIKSFPDDSFI
jgi:hypothetical protein